MKLEIGRQQLKMLTKPNGKMEVKSDRKEKVHLYKIKKEQLDSAIKEDNFFKMILLIIINVNKLDKK